MKAKIIPSINLAACDLCHIERKPVAKAYFVPIDASAQYKHAIETTFCRFCLIKLLEATCEVYH